jgi:hypothetical protein
LLLQVVWCRHVSELRGKLGREPPQWLGRFAAFTISNNVNVQLLM